jgi:phosphate transport system substrate-binding protein
MLVMSYFKGSPSALVCIALAVMVLVTAACGGAGAATRAQTADSGSPAAGTQAESKSAPAAGKVEEPANPAELARLQGNIVVDGSSTVFPISAAAAEEFRRYARDVRITVGISGTGGGFKRFCAGETDISNASRPIRPQEQEACAQQGIEFIELPVAFDGLAVVVNPRNTWVDYLTVAELKKIWEPEAQGKITNWNQVRDSFPDKPLVLFGAGTDSGTFDYFTEAINGKEKASRGDFQASEDDNVLVTGVAGNDSALGFFGYAYVVENEGKVKPVPIAAGEGKQPVSPSVETVKNASYQPLSRPIFIYVRKDAAARPEVKGYVNFYLSKSFTPLIASREIGYIPLPDEVYAAVTKRFNDGVTGTFFPGGAEVGATLDRYLQ